VALKEGGMYNIIYLNQKKSGIFQFKSSSMYDHFEELQNINKDEVIDRSDFNIDINSTHQTFLKYDQGPTGYMPESYKMELIGENDQGYVARELDSGMYAFIDNASFCDFTFC
jgi:hypothetical protein